MIFVTVGTHEQPFDRLIKCMDELKSKKVIDEEVVMQTGYSKYEPEACSWSPFYTYQEMNHYVEKAHIVITHGGPSSFLMPIQMGKIPIVVPRKKEFCEHVNDHQVRFCRAVAEREGTIMYVEDVEELGSMITEYDKLAASISAGMKSNNAEFCRKFEMIVNELFTK